MINSHAAFCPLIGGLAISASDKAPDYIVSTKDFSANDNLYIKYLKKVYPDKDIPYYDLFSEYSAPFKKVDLITIVPPCKGLSTASNKSSPTNKTNDWIITFSEAAAKTGTDIILGENSPKLFTAWGQYYAQKLRDVGLTYGYHLTLWYTNTRLHGIPQSRKRSFFSLTRTFPSCLENSFSLFEDLRSETPDYITFLNSFPFSPSDWLSKSYRDHPTILFLDEIGFDFRTPKIKSTNLLRIISENGFLLRFREYIEKYDSLLVDRLKKMCDLYLKKRIIWDKTPRYIAQHDFPTVMYRSMDEAIRSDSYRTLTVRENMRLMGLPELMDEPPKNLYEAIGQNVPTCTGRWATQSTQILSSQSEHDRIVNKLTYDRILRIDNTKKTITYGMKNGHYLDPNDCSYRQSNAKNLSLYSSPDSGQMTEPSAIIKKEAFTLG